jgi:pyruvate ferredoxin oxidoreductase beta subunit
MKVKHEFYKSPKDIPQEEELSSGAPLCAGCGGLTTLRLMHKVLGEKVVIVNAAGCMTLMATYPYSPIRSSWLYTTMGSVAAGAQGIRDALDIRRAKGELQEQDDMKVLVLAGDGSTYDMGLSATSGAIHRGLDFWYLCYDNEAYGNTGFQMSSSSPFASRTTTSPVGKEEPEGTFQEKKDMFEIWRAQKPPYVATVSSHEVVDLAEKVHRSLAKALGGVVRHTFIPKRFLPVEEYLRPQLRFRHLFEPKPHSEALEAIQHRVDQYWDHVRKTENTGEYA